MKNINFLIMALVLNSCDFKSANDHESARINLELVSVAESISRLMKTHHYSLKELEKESYTIVEKNINTLVKSVQSKEDFIHGFNTLWSNGPFSHVRLANAENPADQMADYIDSMRVGEQGVTLNIENELAILTVNTMTGIDTKERVWEAYLEIQKSKAKNLIIDIRENEGGTFAGIPLLGHLLTEPLDGGVFVSRKWWDKYNQAPDYSKAQDLMPWEGWSIRAFWHDVQEEPLTRIQFQPMTPHFNGKVYVLISNKTASAAEFTVDAMAHLDNVTIIGETTAGEMLSQ